MGGTFVVALATGTQITEVKDVEYQYGSSQIRAEIAEAQRTGSQFRMIVNKGTELSKLLVRLLKNVNAIVEEFDPAGKTFILRNL
jgi:membrane protease subunit (stomatin/prohibitin family)